MQPCAFRYTAQYNGTTRSFAVCFHKGMEATCVRLFVTFCSQALMKYLQFSVIRRKHWVEKYIHVTVCRVENTTLTCRITEGTLCSSVLVPQQHIAVCRCERGRRRWRWNKTTYIQLVSSKLQEAAAATKDWETHVWNIPQVNSWTRYRWESHDQVWKGASVVR